jgi:hypothetical protein
MHSIMCTGLLVYTNKPEPENVKVAFCCVERIGKVDQFFTLEGKHIDYSNYTIDAIGLLEYQEQTAH